jgi:hypothetical protein
MDKEEKDRKEGLDMIADVLEDMVKKDFNSVRYEGKKVPEDDSGGLGTVVHLFPITKLALITTGRKKLQAQLELAGYQPYFRHPGTIRKYEVPKKLLKLNLGIPIDL